MASLILENVSVGYPIYQKPSKADTFVSRIRAAYRGGGSRRLTPVLKNVSMSLRDGDRVGLIGRNGSGKSTLLRTMADILPALSGRIHRQGRMAPIFSAQIGFLPSATGLENIYLRGLLLGMSKREVAGRIDEILDFADIGDWIYQPLSSYSSGMALRLAFAISTAIRPDILLFDEWIGAGDASFIEKANKRLDALMGDVKILVVATHQEKLMLRTCKSAIVLDEGRAVFHGPVRDCLDYFAGVIQPRLTVAGGADEEEAA